MDPLENIPIELRRHIYSFLVIKIMPQELLCIRHLHKKRTARHMIELCREMGFIPSLRREHTGEYAHPSALYFFWIKPKHLRRTYMMARTTVHFCTSLITRRCRICMDRDCRLHQKKDDNVERFLMDYIMRGTMDILPMRDPHTCRQYQQIIFVK